ncbi:MAG: carbamate kinase [Haloarculaceae archaeon]
MRRAVVALGGNALLEDAADSFEAQLATVRETVGHLTALDRAGYDLLLTHGNGPQVGNRLLEQEASDETPDLPLDVLVAETQAQVGAMLQRALDSALDEAYLTVVTQTVVDPDHPAFDDPTKPIGPVYDEATARAKPFPVTAVEGGYRRVVASPPPEAVIEASELAAMVERGQGVVCGGGGGVPVVRGRDGIEGVAAVVDKDHTSRLLATEVDAADLVFVTDVDGVYRDYGGPDEELLRDVTTADLRALLDAGEFDDARGSMRPKVRAAVDFLDAGGERAVVTRQEHLEAALDGEAGTRIA